MQIFNEAVRISLEILIANAANRLSETLAAAPVRDSVKVEYAARIGVEFIGLRCAQEIGTVHAAVEAAVVPNVVAAIEVASGNG